MQTRHNKSDENSSGKPDKKNKATTPLEKYEEKKKILFNQYQALWRSNVNSIGLKKDTSNLFRTRHQVVHKVDVKNFNKIISIDSINLVAELEGMATYGEIVKETLKYGCLPTVVPELKSITIGGALSGGGIEASSFRYGLVHETIQEYEILLGDGRVVICKPNNEHQDLYYGFPNTYGTLGYALKVKVKLIPAKKYVKLTHLHFTDLTDYFQALQGFTAKNRDTTKLIAFIEGVIFSKNNMYITLGEFADEAPFVSNYKYLDIYYRSIIQKKIDYLTTEDFIWRWDTDWFWCSKHFFMQNFLMRLIFGKLVLKSTTFWKIRNFINRNKIANFVTEYLQGRKESVIQDVEIPIDRASTFINFFLDEIGVVPIWVCPTQPYQNKQYDFYKMDLNTLYINFGFWDAVSTNKPDGYFNRRIEAMVSQLNGHKSLYSNVYYTDAEFWKIFDKSAYLKLKEKYDPSHKLRDLFEKCSEKKT